LSWDQFKAIFRTKVFPLLEEYFFEDWEKIRLVLGDNQKKDKALVFVQIDTVENYGLQLFGSGVELDQFGVRPRYKINEDAWECLNFCV
jgi:5-methylcytosine-specific restriction protein B